MIHVEIYRPAKSAMQQGRAKMAVWHMRPVMDEGLAPDALMGWQTSTDTLRQLDLTFESDKEAIKFAKKKGWTYEVLEPKERTFKQKSYAANFTKPLVD